MPLFLCFFCSCHLAKCQKESSHKSKKSLVCPGLDGAGPKKGVLFSILKTPGFQRINLINAGENSRNEAFAKPDQRINTKLKIPILNTDALKVIGGIYYNNEEFSLHNYYNSPEILELNLKQTKVNLSIFNALSEKLYWVARWEMAYNGNFRGLTADRDFRNLTISSFVGYKKNNNTEYGLGLVYREGIFGNRVLPIVMYNHNFSKKWGLEMLLPSRINIRHNLTEKSIINFQTTASTGRYLIKNSDYAEYVSDGNTDEAIFNRIELRTGISYQKQLLPMLWAEIEAGFRNDLDFLGTPETDRVALTSADPRGSYVSFSIFIAPKRKKANQ